MVAKTYEALSDAFDFEIRERNYTNIAKENAETFWDFKHNYIIWKLESSSNELNIIKDLEEEENLIIKRKELLQELPLCVIEKIVNINYWEISKNESELISYLQDNTINNAPKDVLNFIYKLKQYFWNKLKNYQEISKWKIIAIDEEIGYKEYPEIKECEFESRERSIKKWLWTLCNVIVNEAISYDLDSISEISWIEKDILKKVIERDNEIISNKEIQKKLHRFIYRMEYKYDEYCKRYTWIAEWKEYEDWELWIKDLSEIELPREEESKTERKIHKVQIEDIEKEHEREILKNSNSRKQTDKDEHKKNWRIEKVKKRFK